MTTTGGGFSVGTSSTPSANRLKSVDVEPALMGSWDAAQSLVVVVEVVRGCIP